MRRHSQKQAFSLAETLMSLVLVAGLLVVSFDMVGAATVAERLEDDRGRAHLLAAARLAEVMQKSYKDADGVAVAGRETDELLLSPPEFDDVDDFDGLTETLDLSTAKANWTRVTRVVLASPTNASANSLTDQGAKRITVEVRLNERVLATVTAIRTGESSLLLETGELENL